jgi:serine/threonine-protein kinase
MLSADQRVGDYRVLGPIGEGGLGSIFAAVHVRRPEERVAIKVLRSEAAERPEVAARFRREAQAAAAIQHPGVVRVLDYTQLESGASCLIMEYVAGESLEQRLLQRGALPYAEAALLHQQIAAALSAAHHGGIIHRDLKPANVMLLPSPSAGAIIKVVDFGLAKATSADFTEIGTSDGITMLGTLSYMAPEQFLTPSKVDGRADVYSLGVMLYRALCGALPFSTDVRSQGEKIARYYHMHVHQAPPPLPAAVPPPLRALVSRMLAKTPEERPAMWQVDRALARVARDLGVAPSQILAPGAPAPPPWRRLHEMPLWALALLVGAAVFVLGLGIARLLGR